MFGQALESQKKVWKCLDRFGNVWTGLEMLKGYKRFGNVWKNVKRL